MANFVLRVKTKNGQVVLNTIQHSSTVASLKNELSQLSKIPQNNLHVLSGFPPKPIDLSAEDKTLEGMNINSGDTLIVEEKFDPARAIEEPKETWAESEFRRHTAENTMDVPGVLLRKVVPADNSCLFTSIGYVLGGKLTCPLSFQLASFILLVLHELARFSWLLLVK